MRDGQSSRDEILFVLCWVYCLGALMDDERDDLHVGEWARAAHLMDMVELEFLCVASHVYLGMWYRLWIGF